ncbi:MAG: Asp23/Gls24 family envelope stress response protein [Lachnospiraceae bacterium]|nr:Asp23/Gls24 family envelope stress response protein [Lachnospiraceae bacterium]MBP3611132.1 Asp23/Gls24 family envelope stress response protein [Lachnospiraceae bacterium]
MSMEAENITTYDEGTEFVSEVKIAGDVIATIAGLAATEIEGIAFMQGNLTNELVGKLGMKNLTKGVTIQFEEDGASVHVALAVVMKYGYSIPKVCKAVQDRVKNAIESMAGLKVCNVNINIVGVETENDK